MEEKRFCPYCGHQVTPGAKFCRHCGKALTTEDAAQEPITQAFTEPVTAKEEQGKPEKIAKPISVKKPESKLQEPKTTFVKNAEEKAKQTGEAAKQRVQKLKEDYDQKDPETKKKIMRIGGVILVLCIVVFGFNWYQGRDYRNYMANGDTYFQRGEYGEAQKYYKDANSERPGDEKALEMRDHAQTLGDSWVRINDGWDGRSAIKAYNNLESKLKNIEDQKIRLAYEDTIRAIENTDQYIVERQLE